MTILENPEKLKQQNNVVSNIGLEIPVWRTDYIIQPERGFDSTRKTAWIGGESGELVQIEIQKSVPRGVPFQWEAMPGLVVPQINGFTPSLERALYLWLKKKYEGPSQGDILRKIGEHYDKK